MTHFSLQLVQLRSRVQRKPLGCVCVCVWVIFGVVSQRPTVPHRPGMHTTAFKTLFFSWVIPDLCTEKTHVKRTNALFSRVVVRSDGRLSSAS